MLGFLQRYQKVFISCLVAVLCVSFLFFGIRPKHSNGVVDTVAYQLKSGKKIKKSHHEGIKALLETNNGEALIYGKALGAHFFTENFIVSDLMKPGILSLLVDRYYGDLKEELEAQLEREKKFKPYIHPSANFLSAESIWSIRAPELKDDLSKLTDEGDPKKAFELRQKLYLHEESFDPFALWQVLYTQESQFNWLPKDPELIPEKLHLFDYKSTREWIGNQLLQKVTQLVLELSYFANAQGVVVSKKDAEQDLLRLNNENFQKLKALGIKDFETSQEYLQAKLNALGLNRVQMVDLWREILRARRFLNESAQSLLLDTSTLKAFEKYANEKIHVASYCLPKELQFQKKEDWFQFEAYLHALGKPIDKLTLKFKRKPVSEIAQKYPFLVQDRLSLTFQEVSLESCAQKIKHKDVWSYKLCKDNLISLKKEFPTLAIDEKMDSKKIQLFFESLDPKTHYLVDQYIKKSLVEKNQNWVELALDQAQTSTGEFCVRKNGQGLPFKGFENFEGKDFWLSELLSSSSFSDQKESKYFTFDQKHYYQITDFEILKRDELVPYQTLKEDRSLEKLLYLTLKELKPEEGLLDKKFSRAQQLAAEQWLEPLKMAIRNDYLAEHKKTLDSFDDDFYFKHRLYAPMKEALSYCKDHVKSSEKCSLNDLWNLQYQEQTFIRYLDTNTEMDPYLGLNVGHWTKVMNAQSGLKFSHILSKPKEDKTFIVQKHLKNSMGHKLKRLLVSNLLDDNLDL